MSATMKPGEIVLVIWTCLHCNANHETKTDELECDEPRGCAADVHSGWLECSRCGWETRLVRTNDDRIAATHKRASAHGNGKVGTA